MQKPRRGSPSSRTRKRSSALDYLRDELLRRQRREGPRTSNRNIRLPRGVVAGAPPAKLSSRPSTKSRLRFRGFHGDDARFRGRGRLGRASWEADTWARLDAQFADLFPKSNAASGAEANQSERHGAGTGGSGPGRWIRAIGRFAFRYDTKTGEFKAFVVPKAAVGLADCRTPWQGGGEWQSMAHGCPVVWW